MPDYSQDLRKRVIDTVECGDGSLRQIAQRFLVSLSFVVRLLRHYRTTGSLEPKRIRPVKSVLDPCFLT
jgi:transposase